MEATISVICFKSKTLANGEHPLMLRITKDRKRSMKSLNLSVLPRHWDFKKNEPKSNCPNRTLISQVIIKAKLEWPKKLLEKQANEEEFTSDSLIRERKEERRIKTQTVEEFYKSVRRILITFVFSHARAAAPRKASVFSRTSIIFLTNMILGISYCEILFVLSKDSLRTYL